jgi:Fe-S cluster biogenesis protein NfuA
MTDQPNLDSVAQDAPLADQLAALIQNISAYIEHYHGGSVELVAFDGTTAYVRLGGACVAGWPGRCISSSQRFGWRKRRRKC